MGEGNVDDDFSEVELPTPDHWEGYPTDIRCDAQALLGYGREVHPRSGGICLYCGFGCSWQVEPERAFDAWRQLTLEHIVPWQDGELDGEIEEAVEEVFVGLPVGQQERLIGLVKNLNMVTSCHLCNSCASRCQDEAITTFHEHLRAPALDGVRNWIECLRKDIWKLWRFKSSRVRAKLMFLRRSFQDKGVRVLLDVPLAETRPLATPRDLDEKLDHIMDDLMNSHRDLWGPPHV